MQDNIPIYKQKINHLKEWSSSDIWKQIQRIKIQFTKKLSADWSHRILAVIRCSIFCLPFCCPGYKDEDIQNYNCACCFCMGVKLVHSKKNTRLPLFTHSRNCYTCNHTLERKWSDNFNEIREYFLWKTILFPRKNCPRWLETNVTYYHTPRELTLVVKWNTLRNTYSNASTAAPCSTLQGTFIQSVIELNAIIFS